MPPESKTLFEWITLLEMTIDLLDGKPMQIPKLDGSILLSRETRRGVAHVKLLGMPLVSSSPIPNLQVQRSCLTRMNQENKLWVGWISQSLGNLYLSVVVFTSSEFVLADP